MKPTYPHKRAPLAVLLWAALLLAGQTLALAHQHADEGPGASCTLCTLAKAQTAACDAPAAPAETPVQPWLVASADAPVHCAAPWLGFEPRGPPQV